MLDKAEVRIEATEKECQRVIALYNEKVCFCNEQKAKIEALQMDNQQLQSDIINSNQNLDHIEGLWKSEKEKVEKAKQKVINICKELQKAKAEIEDLREIVFTDRTEAIKKLKAEAVREFAEKLEGSAMLVEITNGNGKQIYEEVVTFIEIERIKYEMTEGK